MTTFGIAVGIHLKYGPLTKRTPTKATLFEMMYSNDSRLDSPAFAFWKKVKKIILIQCVHFMAKPVRGQCQKKINSSQQTNIARIDATGP